MSPRATVYGDSALHVVSSAQLAEQLALGSVTLTVGGPAAVVSAQLAQLGHPPRFVGLRGADRAGEFVAAELEVLGVPDDEIAARGQTALVLATVGDGVRLAARPGSSWRDGPWCSDPPEPDGGPVYVTGFPDMVETVRVLGRRGHRPVVDVGFVPLLHDPPALLRHLAAIADAIGVCVISGRPLADQAREDVVALCLDYGVDTVLLTLGGDGVIVATEDGRWELPAYAVEERDPLCAGDSFVAGFLCGVLDGLSPLPAADFGQAVAASKVSRFANLPTRADVAALRVRGRRP